MLRTKTKSHTFLTQLFKSVQYIIHADLICRHDRPILISNKIFSFNGST